MRLRIRGKKGEGVHMGGAWYAAGEEHDWPEDVARPLLDVNAVEIVVDEVVEYKPKRGVK